MRRGELENGLDQERRGDLEEKMISKEGGREVLPLIDMRQKSVALLVHLKVIVEESRDMVINGTITNLVAIDTIADIIADLLHLLKKGKDEITMKSREDQGSSTSLQPLISLQRGSLKMPQMLRSEIK